MYTDDELQENKLSPIAASTLSMTDPLSIEETPAVRTAETDHALDDGLSSLFREHYKGIFRVAHRITGSQSDAEDVLQSIFVRLTLGWSNRDLSPHPRAYLYRAAINASLDLVRKRKRIISVPLEVIDMDLSPKHSVGSPEQNFADSELRDLVREAVAKLEGRSATAFVLRYYEGYDNRQIADILGTSQMVVAVTLHRARTRLRKEIGSYLEKHHEA
jgi:RNA polymerase sigma-70 factor (ECF subfamily)